MWILFIVGFITGMSFAYLTRVFGFKFQKREFSFKEDMKILGQAAVTFIGAIILAFTIVFGLIYLAYFLSTGNTNII